MEAFLVSAGVVALAEVGDKTQLLTLVLASRYGKPWPLLAGIVTATVLNHALAAALGTWIAGALAPDVLRWLLAASLLAMAVWVLIPDKVDDDTRVSRDMRGIFLTTTMLFFLVEMGDKTQIATAALAARYASLGAVVLGSTTGMIVANAPIAFLGRPLANRLPARAIHGIAALIFVTMGVSVLVFG